MILQIFDFDDTLFRIPAHTAAPKTFDISGNVHKWYDHPESLNDSKYVVQCIETVAQQARNSDKDETINILITRRIPELAGEVIRLLKKHDIILDKHYVIGHTINKPDVLAEVLSKDFNEHDFETIAIFEDCMYQIMGYQDFFAALHYPNKIDVRYYFVDKTHLIELTQLKGEVIDKLKLSNP
jgi:hypothetical protein